MKTESVRAQIFLETFFPLLESFVMERQGLMILACGMRTFQIELEDEKLAYQLAVVDGVLKSGVDIVEEPSLVLRFKNLEQLGFFLRGKMMGLPQVKRWSFNDFTCATVASMSAFLGMTLHPSIPLLVESNKRLRAKLLLHAASYAMEAVARLDDEVHSVCQEVDGDVAQISILPSGPSIHVIFRPGRIVTRRGAHPAPDAIIQFENIAIFNDLVSQKLNPLNTYFQRKVWIEGESVLVLMVAFLLQKLMEYL